MNELEIETPAEASLTAPPEIATMLKALGEPTRLRIFQFLRSCCGPVAVEAETGAVRPVSGPTVGEVCCHVTGKERITSTISEHLKDLRIAGLVLIERRGKHMICAVNPSALATLAAFFGDGSTARLAPRKEDSNGPSCC